MIPQGESTKAGNDKLTNGLEDEINGVNEKAKFMGITRFSETQGTTTVIPVTEVNLARVPRALEGEVGR